MGGWIRGILPPILARPLRRRWGTRLRGRFEDWRSAQARCGAGYAKPELIRELAAAAAAVLDGRVAWERDGHGFAEPSPDWRLIALIHAVAEGASPVRILDIGGGMASAWTRNRCWLPERISWRVVEQPGVVAAAVDLFRGHPVAFTADLASALADGDADIVHFGSVLQYLEDPWQLVESCLAIHPRMLFIDRTPFSSTVRKDEIVVQEVPRRLGGARYPSWIFARSAFGSRLPEGYRIFSDEATDDLCDRCDVSYRAISLIRKAQA